MSTFLSSFSHFLAHRHSRFLNIYPKFLCINNEASKPASLQIRREREDRTCDFPASSVVKESTSNAGGMGSTLIRDQIPTCCVGWPKKILNSLTESGLKSKVLKSNHSSLTYSKWEQISKNWSIFYQLKSPD